MPAITSLTMSLTAPLGRALAVAGSRAIRGLKSLVRNFGNRRDARRLAALDDRMLADVGLSRSDLRDAFAELPWRDPSDVLTRRAAERRAGRRLSDFAVGRSANAIQPRSECYPPLNRPSRYLV